MMSRWLQAALESAQMSQSELARLLTERLHRSIDRAAVNKMLKNKRVISADEMVEIARITGMVPPGSERGVPIVGLVGAGPGGTVLFATGDGNYGYTYAPQNVTESTVALEVRGDSMRGYAENGSLITYDELRPPSPDLYKDVLVCFLEDGRVLVKQLLPGSSPGLYHLASSSADIMLDQAVREVAEITNIVPRKAAMRLMRRTGDIDFVDVPIDGT